MRVAADPRALADELMTVTAALRRVVRRTLRSETESHMRGAHIELLRIVEEQPGIGVAAAARELRLVANSVSTLVNQLTSDGMLRRETDPDDRRAVRLHLTDAAAQRLAAWRQARSELVGGTFASLSTMDQEAVAAALPGLRTLVERLEGGQCR
jgi:DNA-binding MarR family transcriptional regulator